MERAPRPEFAVQVSSMGTETAWQVETGQTCQECLGQGRGSRGGPLNPWLEGAGRRLQMSVSDF